MEEWLLWWIQEKELYSLGTASSVSACFILEKEFSLNSDSIHFTSGKWATRRDTKSQLRLTLVDTFSPWVRVLWSPWTKSKPHSPICLCQKQDWYFDSHMPDLHLSSICSVCCSVYSWLKRKTRLLQPPIDHDKYVLIFSLGTPETSMKILWTFMVLWMYTTIFFFWIGSMCLSFCQASSDSVEVIL